MGYMSLPCSSYLGYPPYVNRVLTSFDVESWVTLVLIDERVGVLGLQGVGVEIGVGVWGQNGRTMLFVYTNTKIAPRPTRQTKK